MTAPRYAFLGEVRVSVGDTEHRLGGGRQRDVLAALVAAGGRPVPADRLVADVWGEEAPRQALASLQVAVSRLRTLLEPHRPAREPATRLLSTGSGYALAADFADVDVWYFEHLADRASSAEDPSSRLELAEAALDLWTGVPYPDCAGDQVAREVDRLIERHLSAQEQRADALLALGRPDAAVRALVPVTRDAPYREGAWTTLALAQYRCARQADALDTLRRLRQRLVEDLGVDPSPGVQQLERDLLRQAPSLDAPAAAVPAPIRPTGDDAPSPATDARSAPRPGSVGREATLARVVGLLDSLRDATAVPARVLVVSGEPGIGKSTLVADLISHAEGSDLGATVHVGACQQGDVNAAFWPWLPVVRGLVRSPGVDADPRLEPLLADVPGDLATGGSVLRMYDAVVDLLSSSSSTTPVVVVLEDLHWADVSSLRLLTHVAAARPSGRLLLVVTRRTGEGSSMEEPIVTAMAALARAGAARVRLGGLDAEGVRTLLAEVLEAPEAALAGRVLEATAGNPFFVLEYARLLAGTPEVAGRGEERALPVPDGVRDVLRARLNRLPDRARTLLVGAAVLGRDIDPWVAAALGGVDAEEALDLLDLALATGLLAERGTRYAFAHALTREVIYAEVNAARRMRLHARAAELLEEQADASPDVAIEVGHHAFLAAPLGATYAAAALAALGRAAAVAESRQAHAEALELWSQAYRTAPAETMPLARATAANGMAGALLRQARTAEARVLLDEAVGLAREQGRWDLVADSATILNRAGVWSWREHGVRDQPFIELLTDTAARLDGLDRPRRARVLATLEMELYYGWDREAAERAGHAAVEEARAEADERLLLEVLLVHAIAAWGPGRQFARLEMLRELERHELGGEMEVFTAFQLGVTLHECGRVAESEAVMDRCARLMEGLSHTGVEIPLAWWRVAQAHAQDRADAVTLGYQVLERHRASGFLAGAEVECIHALRLLRAGERVPEETVVAARNGNPGVRAMVALGVAEAGDRATARDLLGEPHSEQASDYSVLPGLCARVATLALLGEEQDLAELDQMLRRLEPYAGQVVNYGTLDQLGCVDHFRAQGLTAAGRAEQAAEALRSALALNHELGNLPWLRRSQVLAGKLGVSTAL